MDILEAKDDMETAQQIVPEELMNTNWSAGAFEQDDSMSSKDQALMLDEVREAMEDMAQMVYKASEMEAAGYGVSTEASSEQAPTVNGEASTVDEEREAEEIITALLANIENAQTVDDLEKIHEIFTARAEMLKGKLATKKSRELIEALLSVNATLSAVRRQIDAARQQGITQINGRQVAEQIANRLAASQVAIKQAAQRMLENAMNVMQQQMMQQSARLQQTMNQTLAANRQQPSLDAERARMAMQQLSAQMAQSQKAMQMAQAAMREAARDGARQQQIMGRLREIMGKININSSLAVITRQLDALKSQLAQQQAQARDANTREQASQQAVQAKIAQSQVAEMQLTAQIQQRLVRAAEVQNNAATLGENARRATLEATRSSVKTAEINARESATRAANDVANISQISSRESARQSVKTSTQAVRNESVQQQNSLREVANKTQVEQSQKQQQVAQKEAVRENDKTQQKPELESAKLNQKLEQARQEQAKVQKEASKADKPDGVIKKGTCKPTCPCSGGCGPALLFEEFKQSVTNRVDSTNQNIKSDLNRLAAEGQARAAQAGINKDSSAKEIAAYLRTLSQPQNNPKINGSPETQGQGTAAGHMK